MSMYPAMRPLTMEQWDVVTEHRGLVPMVATKILNLKGQSLEEALSNGQFGLMRAAQKYDPDMGFAFSTYAVRWIRNAIQRGAADLEGVNYRRARRGRCTGYERPSSLDERVPDGGSTLGALLISEGHDDDVAQRAAAHELLAVAVAACRGGVDRAVLAGVVRGIPTSETAVALGITRKAVNGRLERLRSRVLAEMGCHAE